MHRLYAYFSAVVLIAFISLIAIKINSEIIPQAATSIEEADIEDIQDDQIEEIQFQLKDVNSSKEISLLAKSRMIHVSYRFTVKSNSQKVSSPPPEA